MGAWVWVLRGERDSHCGAGGRSGGGRQGCVLSIQIPDGRFRGGLALFSHSGWRDGVHAAGCCR